MVFLGLFRTLCARNRLFRAGESLKVSLQRGRHPDGNIIVPDPKWKQSHIFRMTRGYYGRKAYIYSFAVRNAHRAMRYSTIARFLKKKHMRELWDTRLNGACAEHGIEYKDFMAALSESDVQLNRKVLHDICIFEPRSFQSLVVYAKQRLDEVGIYDTVKPVPEGVITKSMAEKKDKIEERKLKKKIKNRFDL